MCTCNAWIINNHENFNWNALANKIFDFVFKLHLKMEQLHRNWYFELLIYALSEAENDFDLDLDFRYVCVIVTRQRNEIPILLIDCSKFRKSSPYCIRHADFNTVPYDAWLLTPCFFQWFYHHGFSCNINKTMYALCRPKFVWQ